MTAGQTAGRLIRRLGRGGGTTVPGRIAARLDPAVTRKLAGRLEAGSVIVTATNGKTTTSRLIAAILGEAGRAVVHNRSGANLASGVASALVRAAHPAARSRSALGLFEVDEASVPDVAAAIRPRIFAFGNLFRDQLDRYGEVTYVAGAWRRAIEALPAETWLVLNADDPNVAALGRGRARVIYVGVDDDAAAGSDLEHTADARLCPVCGARLVYQRVFYGHLGDYRCSACGFHRPRPTLSATAIELDGLTGARATLAGPEGRVRLVSTLPGLYNIYNVLLALGVTTALGSPLEPAAASVARFGGAFGRIERLTIDGRQVYLALAKNPVGMDQVLRAILRADPAPTLVIVINDHLADGTDVSWLWDVDVERLAAVDGTVTASGTRARDMAVRLKYAAVPARRVRLEPSPISAVDAALRALEPGGTLYVVLTYTAMLELRSEMVRRGHVAPFWED